MRPPRVSPALLLLLLLAACLAGGGVTAAPAAAAGGAGHVVSRLTAPVLNEVSGVAASRRHDGVLYMVNDSGANNTLYAVSALTGRILATFTVRSATNCDWEDLAIGPAADGGADYIYIGDVGGNARLVCQTLYRVREPTVLQDTALDVDASFTYSWDESNCETVLVDPAGHVYLVAKTQPGTTVRVYRVPPTSWASSQVVELTRGTPVNIDLERRADGPVAGDISPDGSEILLKTYNNVYRYNVSTSESIEEALQGDKDRLVYTREKQGESITFDKSGAGFYTVSEGQYAPIWYYNKTIDLRPPSSLARRSALAQHALVLMGLLGSVGKTLH